MLLAEGELGRLVPTESVEALTEALAAHLDDPRPLRAAADRGPEFARRFDPQRLSRQHLAILARVAERDLPAGLTPELARVAPDRAAGAVRRAA
jgi:glycosyltransferase involved in cell wall biosynthesis